MTVRKRARIAQGRHFEAAADGDSDIDIIDGSHGGRFSDSESGSDFEVLPLEKPVTRKKSNIKNDSDWEEQLDIDSAGADDHEDDDISGDEVQAPDDGSLGGSSDESSAEEAESWGEKRDYYGKDEAQSIEDLELEKQEAARLQKAELARLLESDFDIVTPIAPEQDKSTAATAVLGQNVTKDRKIEKIERKLTDEDRLRLLDLEAPEALALADEFCALRPMLKELKLKVYNETVCDFVRLKLQCLSLYLANVSAYFALRWSGDVADMSTHPVIDSLMKSRACWSKIAIIDDDGVSKSTSEKLEQAHLEEGANHSEGSNASATDNSFVDSSDESEEIDKPIAFEEGNVETAEIGDEDRQVLNAGKIVKPSVKLNFELSDDLLSQSADANDHSSEYGESERINDAEAEEIRRRRKSLRFFAAQIEQKIGRTRKGAEGDVDLPYKDREDWQLRQQQASAAAAAKAENSELDTANDDEYDQNIVQSTAASNKKDQKSQQKSLRKNQRDMQLESQQEEDGEASETKRGITYEISKNKGLTPKRPKENRNPRVKKRKKFEKALKRHSSRQAVFKGKPQGAYGGEMTGIKANLIRSVRLWTAFW